MAVFRLAVSPEVEEVPIVSGEVVRRNRKTKVGLLSLEGAVVSSTCKVIPAVLILEGVEA